MRLGLHPKLSAMFVKYLLKRNIRYQDETRCRRRQRSRPNTTSARRRRPFYANATSRKGIIHE
jgi:hypothetical protein